MYIVVRKKRNYPIFSTSENHLICIFSLSIFLHSPKSAVSQADFRVKMSVTGAQIEPIADLAERVRTARSTLRNLVGAAVDHRCGICGRLDTDHVGNSSVGCTDANEIGDDALRHSLNLELESVDALITKVRNYDGLQLDLSEVRQRLAKSEMDFVTISAEYKETKSNLEKHIALLQVNQKEQIMKLQSDHQAFKVRSEAVCERLRKAEAKVDELEVENSETAGEVSQLWEEMIKGETSEAVLKRLLKDKHDVDVSDDVFAFLSAPRAPNIDTPTKPSTPGAGASTAGATAGATFAGTTSPAGRGGIDPTAHLAPPTAPLGDPGAGATGDTGTSPATGQVYAAGGAPNGDFIGKSVKTIKVTFNKNDVAHHHVQKESSLLNEVGLIYPSSNLATLISIFIAHCDPATKGIAISVRDTVTQPFADMNEFLAAFREARYPTFHDDCKLAYNELKQSPKESAVQFYYRFEYLLKAMSRNVEDYWDDFLKKLAYSKVREAVRVFPKTGKSVRDMASHCCLLENELGLRKLSYQRDAKYGVSAVNSGDDSNDDNNRGRSKGKGNGGKGKGRSKSRGKGAKTGVFDLLGIYGIDKKSCFHCFDSHNAKDGPCSKNPCLFCGQTGHQPIRCEKAPKTQAEFKKFLKKDD